MIDPNVHEAQSLHVASMAGGAFVEQIGKTDLTQWSELEWATLVDVIITAFQECLRQAYANDPPF